MPNLSSALRTAPFLAALLLTGCGPSSQITTTPPISSVTPPYPTVTSAGAITMGQGLYNVTQNTGSFSVPVYRNSGSTGSVTVKYSTSDGPATPSVVNSAIAVAGIDYTAVSGTLTWADGDTSVKTITIPFLDKAAYTGTRLFSVNLSSPTGGAVLNSFLTTFINITNNLTPPAPTFDFTNYKLTLPVDIYGGTGGTNNIQFEAATILPATLNAGFSDSYFYLNSANQIVFTAPAGGAVTTPGSGSDHTRSELRELYTGTGADSNSDWNSNIGGNLTATVNVTQVAATSDEATFGQIHGQNQAFVILLYRPAPISDVAVQIYPSPTDSSTSARTSILTGVALNDKLTYSIDYRGNNLVITVNDVTKNTTKTSTFDETPWATQPVYFKIGAYHAAPNTTTTTAQTQVVVSAFKVTH